MLRFSGRFEGYSLKRFQKDIVAGMVVGVVAIPLGMAFAIASGVKPEHGLYTVIVAGILISLLGGSKYQIGGPTGAFVPILFAIVLQYGFENLLIAGFMAGVILVILGLLKLGKIIKFIPRPVIIGFTAGIAVIIFTGEIAKFLGLRNVEKHESFYMNMREVVINLNTLSFYSILTAVVSLFFVLFTPKVLPKVPGALAGLLVSTVMATMLFPEQVVTIGSAYGEIPRSLPSFQFPELSLEKIIYLMPPALAIAMLGGIESLLSAMVADNMKGTRHDSNKELVGQGIANIAAPLFGGIPATGAIARTATNIKTGAASPISGIVHGVFVLLVLLLFAPYASLIPLASMSPILMVVAWNMSERKEFINILKIRNSDSAVLVVTFLLTVWQDLVFGVAAGILLAIITFIARMSKSFRIKKDVSESIVQSAAAAEEKHFQRSVSIYSVEGPLFFGSSNSLEDSILDKGHPPKLLILLMNKVDYMDSSAEGSLMTIVNRVHQQNGKVMIVGLQQQPRELLHKTGLFHKIGKKHFVDRPEQIFDVT
ncbi:solute carrier family 23 protein [Bacillus sp. FSL W8-0445]|jgi:SulP family sulfate permease|uniref:Sulfate transporter/antisigma-factor antagonist n=5 Tax=Bacillus licheniformis TaxID=1402 RepID=Q65EI1_BACLD|nr:MULTISPECIES: solute carrier family 23 protein [Bacillus]MBJ7888241.1 STAS domain-containing protein [Bacillaceae bacterium HSR45]AAU25163.1 Sulfate transporter/antisigma-factor antagonist [Bacillus licheniformis DSM 13 = ATCC 14580]AAU42533.1 sulfate transporter YvdB [Bacillus licheniformis DSM 13 = ATCC 14580]AMR12068.1 sodium-independent anion transporter [Bacillus licheniformis]AOP16942.1 Putative sulfate transporter YvdB [Bacillus licheniformis]